MIDENFLLIPLYAHKKEEEYYNVLDLQSKKYPLKYPNRYPKCYFNDIVGYAVLYVHGKDISIYYYLNCDKRKIYNRDCNYIESPNAHFFRYKGYRQGDVVVILEYNNKSIKKYFNEILEILDKQCKEWKIYFDKESYIKKIKYFDFERYWNNQSDLEEWAKY